MPKGKVVARITEGGALLTGAAAEKPLRFEDLVGLMRAVAPELIERGVVVPEPGIRPPLLGTPLSQIPPRRADDLPWTPLRSMFWAYNRRPREGGPAGIASTQFREIKDDRGVPLLEELPDGWVWSDDPRAIAELERLRLR